MNITRIVMGLLLVLLAIAPLMGNEKRGTRVNNFSFSNFSSSSAEAGAAKAAESSGGGGGAAAGTGIGCVGTLLAGIIAAPIILTAVYTDGYGYEEEMRGWMIATISILNTVVASGLTVGVSFLSAMIFPYGSMIFSLSCATAATGALIAGIILSDRYQRLQDRSREVIAGLSWAWSSFAATLIPALTGAICGIAWGIVLFRENLEDKEKRVSLILGPDRIGVTISL